MTLETRKLSAAEQDWSAWSRNLLATGFDSTNWPKPKFNGAGSAIGIVYDNKFILRDSYGRRNLITKQPFDFDTICGIRSVTKEHTGAVISRLIDQGLMSLDDKVGDYAVIQACAGLPVGPQGNNPGGANRNPVNLDLTIRHYLGNAAMIDFHGGTITQQPTDFYVDPNSAIDQAKAFYNKSYGQGNWLGPGQIYVTAYLDKAPMIAALCAQEAAGKSFWDLTMDMYKHFGMTRSFPSMNHDPLIINRNTFYSYEPSQADLSNLAIAYANTGTGVPEGDPSSHALGGQVSFSASWALGIGTCMSTLNDLSLWASKITQADNGFISTAGIQRLFYNNMTPLNDGYAPASSAPNNSNPLYYNGTNPPWTAWTEGGGYIHRQIEGYHTTGGVGFGGLGGHGALWLGIPELKLSGVMISSGGSQPNTANLESILGEYVRRFIN